MIKVTVIGAGLFGISVACELSKKYFVDLYEKSDDILQAASGINQFRLHRGYHYPRSPETATTSLLNEKSFKREFGDAVITNTENYYCIAKNNSLTSASKFISFCQKNNLDYIEKELNLINRNMVDLCVKVNENLIDPKKLKSLCMLKLAKSKVNLHLSKEAGREIFGEYDFIIICTYANSNALLPKNKQRDYQFELCEKIVVELPKEFKNKSIVILDGPFMCIDPLGKSGLFLMGNVVHAIHQTNVGKYPRIKDNYKNLLNKGIIKNPPVTNFKKFIESSEQFIPLIKKAKYKGSMFTVRVVLPNKEKTDERPTLITRINDKTFMVFSGKLGSCVYAAQQLRETIDRQIS